MVTLRAADEHASTAVRAHPPHSCPVLVVVIDEHGDPRVVRDVAQTLQVGRALGLVVDREEDGVTGSGKTDGHHVGTACCAHCREPRHASLAEATPDLGLVHAASVLLYR